MMVRRVATVLACLGLIAVLDACCCSKPIPDEQGVPPPRFRRIAVTNTSGHTATVVIQLHSHMSAQSPINATINNGGTWTHNYLIDNVHQIDVSVSLSNGTTGSCTVLAPVCNDNAPLSTCSATLPPWNDEGFMNLTGTISASALSLYAPHKWESDPTVVQPCSSPIQ
jgi:hypothetical protein